MPPLPQVDSHTIMKLPVPTSLQVFKITMLPRARIYPSPKCYRARRAAPRMLRRAQRAKILGEYIYISRFLGNFERSRGGSRAQDYHDRGQCVSIFGSLLRLQRRMCRDS